MARISAVSPFGVPVAWATTASIASGAELGLLEGELHRPLLPPTRRLRRGRVEGVGDGAVAAHDAVDAGAAGPGVVLALEEQHRRALAADDAATRDVERQRGPTRIGLLRRHPVGVAAVVRRRHELDRLAVVDRAALRPAR